jgi:hypothetical protein
MTRLPPESRTAMQTFHLFLFASASAPAHDLLGLLERDGRPVQRRWRRGRRRRGRRLLSVSGRRSHEQHREDEQGLEAVGRSCVCLLVE